jgi:RTX calcium-binding nonapeptide repeat (4 copies)/Concanavalin A-like lectin/glucanases superfamily
MRRGSAVLGILLGVAALTILPATAPAAGTLKGDYRLEGNHSSSCGAPPNLTDIGPGSNAFKNEFVAGNVDGVLTFPADNGLELKTAGILPQLRYTVIMQFRLDNVGGVPQYRRLLAFDANEPTRDSGLYVLNGSLTVYDGASHSEPSPSVSAGQYIEVALTRDSAGQINVYANGAPRISYDDSVNGVGALLDNAIVFFRDNVDEESAGAVARIRVYDDALSPAQVLAPPACPKAPGPAPRCAGKQATITGTPGNDKLAGTPRRDVVVALGGNDTVSGGKGNDLICGGAGRDTLKGGEGKDTLLGQNGKDRLKGGSGRDICKGSKGKDTASKCEVERSI